MVFRSLSPKPSPSLADDIASLSTLNDRVRASVFVHVASSGREITRDQAAQALGITRRAAAFHLDKLAEAGLVEVSFKRTTGRSGPGAGRSSKLYRRSARRLNVSIPARNYELMARLLASLVVRPDGESEPTALEPRGEASERDAVNNTNPIRKCPEPPGKKFHPGGAGARRRRTDD